LRSKDFLADQKITPLRQKLIEKYIKKLKYEVSVVNSRITATMAMHAERHLWIHTLGVLL
jgi:hypothetical protein